MGRSEMILPQRRKPGRKKQCATKGCKQFRNEGLRFCGGCANKVQRGMESSGYLTPRQSDIQFFYKNGMNGKEYF